jgi:hypothetical protein
MLFTLDSRMVIDHIYLTRYVYSNLSLFANRFGRIPPLPEKRAPDNISARRLTDLRIPTQFLSPHNH